MSKYFGRLARVRVQTKNTENPILFPLQANTRFDVQALRFGPDDLQVRTDAALSDRLHIKFHVEKDVLGQPNRLDLTVFNLSATTRESLQDVDGYVTLQAGYQSDGDNLPTIFEGNARTIDHERIGADWFTHIQCGDGESACRFGWMNRTWASGTRKADIAADLARAIKAGESSPNNIKIDRFLSRINENAVTPATITFTVGAFWSGYTVSGNAFDALRALLGREYDLFVIDGELVALNGVQTTTSEAFLLDAAHGLIGSPSHGAPKAGSSVSILKATSLLNARFNPGTLIQLSALKRKLQNYRVQKVVHVGDIAGNDWQSELELIPINADSQVSQ